MNQLLNPPNRRIRDPYVRWCGRRGVARLLPIPIRQTREVVKETRRMYANWTALLAIVLLTSCSNRDSTDGDKSKVSADRAHETSAGAVDSNPQLKYTSGIRSIFEDSKGRFWFGSHQEGVCLYDGREFIYYTASDGLSDNQVRTIQEDQAGVMWFATGNGITSFDGDEFEIRTGGSHGSPDVATGDAWHTEAGDLWFPGDGGMRRGIAGQGVYRYDGRSLSYLAFPLPPGIEEDNPYLITGIVKGRDGTVWFGTYPGVFRYDGRSFTVINDETAGIETGMERFHVRSIFEDSRGNLWIGNNGLGVLLYDGQAVSNFTEQHGLEHQGKGAVRVSRPDILNCGRRCRQHLVWSTRQRCVALRWRVADELHD